ncbi:MAG: hypothetical protein QM790_17355 [Nibricoccus sp.]
MHPVDILIISLYLGLIFWLGRRAASTSQSEESFFLAGRKLGRLYQIFLNFGNATEPQGAVATASFVYERGASGAWYSFQTIFMNPYYWFMNVWFRRARMLTMADLFVERYRSRALAQFYALFQVGVTILMIGFGCFTAYTIGRTLVVKPESRWTPDERASIENYREWQQLEKRAGESLSIAETQRLTQLRQQRSTGAIASDIPVLNSLAAKAGFCLCFVGIVAVYMVAGGMKAAALNEALQGLLIIVFSVLLLPVGLHAVGGWSQLGSRVPQEMFRLFGLEGTKQFAGWTIFALTLASIVQVNALSSNMNIMGSARTELAARVGVAGFYVKRVMVILWTFAGLIAVAIFSRGNELADPDTAWGVMSRQLLGPGLMGLMIVGIAAGVMSNLAAKAMACASLFVQNFCHPLWASLTEKQGVRIARWTMVVVLLLGALSACLMSGMESVMRLVITVNVPFGAVVVLMLFWRRLTKAAVWCALVSSIAINLVVPLVASEFSWVREHPSLILTVDNAQGFAEPLYFDKIVSPSENILKPVGVGRFNLEVLILERMGVDVAKLGANGRLAAQCLWDVIFPFAVMIAVTLMSRKKDEPHVAQFFGKMKTPVESDPALDHQAMEATRANPQRFDHLKIFGAQSSWEFVRWDRTDIVGFVACCAVSGALIGVFCLALWWASGV